MDKPLFELGRVVATPGALDAMDEIDAWEATVHVLLTRHVTGDWGDVDEHDQGVNRQAVESGQRILSQYTFGERRIWIITEADRSATTILLPEEY